MPELVIVTGSRWMRLICGHELYHKLPHVRGRNCTLIEMAGQFQKRTMRPEQMVRTIHNM
jgi:hypothetical protein